MPFEVPECRWIASGLCLLIASFLSGCETVPEARYVEKSPDFGVIALPYYSTENRALADQLMRQHFPDGYQVDREFEHVTGSITEQQEHGHVAPYSEIHHAGGSDEHPPQSHQRLHHPTASERRSVSTTRDTTEWRIVYSRTRE